MTRAATRSTFEAAAPYLWVAYLVAPVAEWGLFAGRPLGFGAAAALAAVCWLWFARGTPGWGRVIAIALAAKIIIGPFALAPRGFEARYYANPDFSGTLERSTEGWGADLTRVDRSLGFGEDQRGDLPLAFFNETGRFNFYRDSEPARETLPFSVSWQGLWRVTEAGVERIYVHAPGGSTQIVVDRFHASSPATDFWTADVTLTPGFHRVSVSLSTPQGGARQFEAGRLVGDRRIPFDDEVIFQRPVPLLALAVDAVVRRASTIVDVLLASWLAGATLWALGRAWHTAGASFDTHAVLSLLWAAGIVDAFVFARPAAGRMMTLSGGNDWLTYEDLARDIGLNGLLMLSGAAPGHGHAFYYQPLYPYFLAGCHWLFGEGLFGPHLMQRLLAAATAVALWRTTARLFGEKAGAAGLLVAWIVVYEKFSYWSGILLSEVIFVPLVCWWLLLLVPPGGSGAWTTRRAIGAGLVGGLATLARSTLMLAWPIAAAAAYFSIGRAPRRLAGVAAMMAALLAVTSLATARNWIAAHQFVPVATSGSVNLAIGNAPPVPIVTPPERIAAYKALGFDDNTQAVVEYARQAPGSFLAGLGRKALYALGWGEPLVPNAGVSPFYLVRWMAAAAGLGVLWSGMVPAIAGCSAWAGALPLLLALTHFAAIVIVFPHVYGDRLIIPFYALLVPYAALSTLWLYQAMSVDVQTGVLFLLWTAAFALCVWPLMGGTLWLFDVPVIVGTLVLACFCAFGLPRLHVGLWPYAAYAAAMLIWLVQAGTAQAASATAAEWLFLIVAIGSRRLVSNGRARRVAAVLIVGACAAATVLLVIRTSVVEALKGVLETISFERVAVPAGLIGAAALLTIAVMRPARRRLALLAWVAGAGLAIAAVAELGIIVYPERSFLRGMRARVGIAGALCYALVWIRATLSRQSTVDRRQSTTPVALIRGVIGGIFIAELFGVNLHPPAGTAMLAAGLMFGAAEGATADSSVPALDDR